MLAEAASTPKRWYQRHGAKAAPPSKIPTIGELLAPIIKRDETIARRLVHAPTQEARWVIWHNIPRAWRYGVLAHVKAIAQAEVFDAAKRVVLLAEIEVMSR